MPLQRRLPKVGFNSRMAKYTAELRLHELAIPDADEITIDVLKEWFYYFYQCTECRRCSVFCPYGIDTADITMITGGTTQNADMMIMAQNPKGITTVHTATSVLPGHTDRYVSRITTTS